MKRGDTQSREEEKKTQQTRRSQDFIDKIAESLGWEKMRREGLKKRGECVEQDRRVDEGRVGGASHQSRADWLRRQRGCHQ